MVRILFVSILLVISQQTLARMYQWVEPDTGTTQLSGKPPAWYRSDAGGPRVLVFEKGRLIDDTSIEMSQQGQRELRRRAFIKAEQDREAAREKLVRSKELKSTYQEEPEELVIPDINDDVSPDAVLEELQQSNVEMTEQERIEEQRMMEQMREMVEDWERTQSGANDS